jgi:peptide/nickel transport system permease protein
VIHGTRTSLVIGVGAALLAVLIGAPVGLTAGYLGGRTDIVVVQLIDLFIALPGLVLALIITVMVGPSLQNLVLVLGFVMWPVVARLVRGPDARGARARLYRGRGSRPAARRSGSSAATSGRTFSASSPRSSPSRFRSRSSLRRASASSASAFRRPVPDWGSMVRSGFDVLAINPALSLAPGGAIATLVLGFYLVGNSGK